LFLKALSTETNYKYLLKALSTESSSDSDELNKDGVAALLEALILTEIDEVIHQSCIVAARGSHLGFSIQGDSSLRKKDDDKHRSST